MRVPLVSLLIAAAAGLAGAGCASKPAQEDPPVAATAERGCAGDASDPLNLTSTRIQAAGGDPEVESILQSGDGDPRLVRVNRQMYQSLHALDVELRREQRIAACERSQSGLQRLEAQAGAGANGTASRGATSANAADAGTADVTGMAAGAPAVAAPQSTLAGSGATRSTLAKKSVLPASSGGGNGATMQKVVAGSDNDVVARRLRKAAEQETNPALREKLWKEYADYRQGIAAK
jgi:hypothetical protein